MEPKNKRTIKLLQRAATLIEKGWARGWFAKDKYGKNLVNSCDKRAVKFCTIGAIRKASRDIKATEADIKNAKAALGDSLNIKSYALAEWNDNQKDKKDVLKVFKMTIKSLQQ